jgi:hypothetical protein
MDEQSKPEQVALPVNVAEPVAQPRAAQRDRRVDRTVDLTDADVIAVLEAGEVAPGFEHLDAEVDDA